MADPVLASPTPAVISRAEAKALGLTHYFTGKPCKNGHVAKRLINRRCVLCAREAGQAYRLRHGERAKKISDAWRAANPDKVRGYRKAWEMANYDRGCESKKVWERTNYDRLREMKKAWKQANQDKVRTSRLNRIAKSAMAQGSHTAADIKRIYDNQHGECKYCREKLGDKYHVDHRKPLSKGGSNYWHNLQILCPPCNLRKSNKDPIEYEWENGFC